MSTNDTPAGFDPGRYLTKLSRRQKVGDTYRNVEQDYLEVKWRLLWLRTEHPEAQIDTELVQVDSTHCIVRARVAIPNGGAATGIGSETDTDWKDYIEKAETKALGRALAALGYGTQFCTDHEFNEPERVVDAPVARSAGPKPPPQTPPAAGAAQPARPQGPPPGGEASRASPQQSPGWQERPATEPQIKAIHAIGRGAQGMDDGALEELCRDRYGCALSELSRRQASELIDALKLGAAS